MKSLTFSCWICALNRGATKPIFCSKVAQKGKILLEVARTAKICSKRQKLPSSIGKGLSQVTQAL